MATQNLLFGKYLRVNMTGYIVLVPNEIGNRGERPLWGWGGE